MTCSLFRLQAKRHMELWVPSLRAGQETVRLVSSQIGMWQLTWITQIKRCSIRCHQVLDPGCIWVLLRGQHHSSQTISGMGYLLGQTQVILVALYICRIMYYLHVYHKIKPLDFAHQAYIISCLITWLFTRKYFFQREEMPGHISEVEAHKDYDASFLIHTIIKFEV